MTTGIGDSFQRLRMEVDLLAHRFGRVPEEVSILGVSKKHSAESVVHAIQAGLSEIGENRIQEAVEKIPKVIGLLKDAQIDSTSLRWHMIGHLQSNKARKAAELFDVIQSVDNIKIANKLNSICEELNKKLDLFIEVNVSREANKSGITIDELNGLAAEIIKLRNVSLTGIMAIGPNTDDYDVIKNSFLELKSAYDDLLELNPDLSRKKLELSLGMSNDYQIAIETGSTMIRIGTAIFGKRPDFR